TPTRAPRASCSGRPRVAGHLGRPRGLAGIQTSLSLLPIPDSVHRWRRRSGWSPSAGAPMRRGPRGAVGSHSPPHGASFFWTDVAGSLHPGFGLTRYFEPVAARAYTAISSGRSISGSETSLE